MAKIVYLGFPPAAYLKEMAKADDATIPDATTQHAYYKSKGNEYTYIQECDTPFACYAIIHADSIYLCIETGEDMLKHLKTGLEMRVKINPKQPLQLYACGMNADIMKRYLKKETTKEYDMWFHACLDIQGCEDFDEIIHVQTCM